MYETSLSELQKEIISLIDKGYNVSVSTVDVDIDEKTWLSAHLNTSVEHLRNGIEFAVDREDYRTADMIQKIINLKEGDITEVKIYKYLVKKKLHE
jgi:bacterioferritin (cytochrome b1)